MSTCVTSYMQSLMGPLSVLLLAASVPVGGCSKSAAPKADDFAAVSAATPVATVEAVKLTAAYSDSALTTEAQYSGKVIEVPGRFLLNQKMAADGGADVWHATIDGGETKGSLGISMFVDCYFNSDNPAEKQRFAALKKGDTIRIKGKVSQPRAFTVDLRGCVLL